MSSKKSIHVSVQQIQEACDQSMKESSLLNKLEGWEIE